jgi:TRAP-type uncharacterized transport system fused permease subunit
MLELVFVFISFIIKIVKYYLFTLLPVLILISIMCVLFGMCIRSGIKGSMAIVTIILTIIIFIFVIYGKDSIKIFQKIKSRLVDKYFSGKAVLGDMNYKGVIPEGEAPEEPE